MTVSLNQGREGLLCQVVSPALAIRCAPKDDAALLTEALMGEYVRVLEEKDGWARLQTDRDGYAGYGLADELATPAQPVTHWVRVPQTFLYPRPDIKSQPAQAITLNAQLQITDSAGSFGRLSGGRFVFARHIGLIGEPASDYVAVAETLLHAPYLWGGKRPSGLDCSALIQLALHAGGHACPRDSNMQELELGQSRQFDESSTPARGDLVFWTGHVAMMLDRETLLHASGHHMQVVRERLRQAIERIGRDAVIIARLAPAA
ncbi:MAG: NlpC/P60 family protein [Hyphomicrobiales bacterium]